MARAQYNVLILPYFKKSNSGYLYCIFKRKDMKIWQFVAGGGEDNEFPMQAAIRELYEESGIISSKIKELRSMTYVPNSCFSKISRETWGMGVYVIPVHCFAVEVADLDIKLSNEHIEYKWVNSDVANELLHFDIDKTALYEIDEINKNGI